MRTICKYLIVGTLLIFCCISCDKRPLDFFQFDELAPITETVFPSNTKEKGTDTPLITPSTTQAKPSYNTVTPTLTSIQISFTEMSVIVGIVENFKEEKGEYPSSLEDMIPEYLESTPYTHQGFEISYELHDRAIFIVIFYPAENRYCSYTKYNDIYECGFFDPGHYNDD